MGTLPICKLVASLDARARLRARCAALAGTSDIEPDAASEAQGPLSGDEHAVAGAWLKTVRGRLGDLATELAARYGDAHETVGAADQALALLGGMSASLDAQARADLGDAWIPDLYQSGADAVADAIDDGRVAINPEGSDDEDDDEEGDDE